MLGCSSSLLICVQSMCATKETISSEIVRNTIWKEDNNIDKIDGWIDGCYYLMEWYLLSNCFLVQLRNTYCKYSIVKILNCITNLHRRCSLPNKQANEKGKEDEISNPTRDTYGRITAMIECDYFVSPYQVEVFIVWIERSKFCL